jgi:hypothetical protein
VRPPQRLWLCGRRLKARQSAHHAPTSQLRRHLLYLVSPIFVRAKNATENGRMLPFQKHKVLANLAGTWQEHPIANDDRISLPPCPRVHLRPSVCHHARECTFDHLSVRGRRSLKGDGDKVQGERFNSYAKVIRILEAKWDALREGNRTTVHKKKQILQRTAS